MIKLNSYLTFNGNCREAMTFYAGCLGGELTFQTIDESPLSERMPQKMKNCILHSTITKDGFLLMGSDIVNENGLIKGNNVSLSLSCGTEEEIYNYYAKLSDGGFADHPLENSFWGALFGDLTDKYGNHWILDYNKKQHL
jgi:PhnB protein